MKYLVFFGAILSLTSCVELLYLLPRKDGKAEDFKYYDPNFKLPENTLLRTDGIYVRLIGNYQEKISLEKYTEFMKYAKMYGTENDKLPKNPPKNDTVFSYSSYHALIFCAKNGAYYDHHIYSLDDDKLAKLQRYMTDSVCTGRYKNYYYKIENNLLKLQHRECPEQACSFYYEKARITKDTLFYKQSNHHWKKRTESIYIFMPFKK